ncbi:hypothetical protein TrST_g4740 [Triparma strigata]|uniref:D-isomer specific 2-hydroxyacid dehydrogenase NAD-binding domain-containing protein n=1 Tax=Triparma strigata TaxID=1606541 RepID=A0A9W7EKV0_9STRA|nr:hypothetical protein TrST_g4740 [Triparma strigata]
MSDPIVRKANVLVLAKDVKDPNNQPVYDLLAETNTGKGSIIGTSSDVGSLSSLPSSDLESANVLFCSYPDAELVKEALKLCPNVEWVHCRSAGVEHVMSEELTRHRCRLTNAKGCFSSTLAEYTLTSIGYFAKDFPRLNRQKKDKNWEKYSVREISKSTLGIIGYGDIGKASAKLAKAYGMNVLALRRNPSLSSGDPLVDVCYDNSKESLNKLMSESDYVLVAAPLTPATVDLVDAEALSHAKQDCVIINVGRGPIINEVALIESLKSKKLRGAALDVFTVEPLPVENDMWALDNVLLSPHNMDQTETFMREAAESFCGLVEGWVRGDDAVGNAVDKEAGY